MCVPLFCPGGGGEEGRRLAQASRQPAAPAGRPTCECLLACWLAWLRAAAAAASVGRHVGGLSARQPAPSLSQRPMARRAHGHGSAKPATARVCHSCGRRRRRRRLPASQQGRAGQRQEGKPSGRRGEAGASPGRANRDGQRASSDRTPCTGAKRPPSRSSKVGHQRAAAGPVRRPPAPIKG